MRKEKRDLIVAIGVALGVLIVALCWLYSLLTAPEPSVEVDTSQSSLTDTQRVASIVKKRAKPYVPDSIIETIVSESLKYKYGLLYLSIISVESGFDIFARSNAGAVGCGQVKYTVWKDTLRNFGINSYRDMFDPRYCVRALHIVYSTYLRKAKGDYLKALQYYVCGNRRGKACEAYANKVLTVYGLYMLQLEREWNHNETSKDRSKEGPKQQVE